MTRVLIVDDEQMMRDLLSSAIAASKDWTVDVGESVAEGKALLKNHTYELLVFDKNLPDGTGLDLIRWNNTHGTPAPVILITAYGSTKTAAESLELGIRAYLEKPFPAIGEVLQLFQEVISTPIRPRSTGLRDAVERLRKTLDDTASAPLPRKDALIYSPDHGSEIADMIDLIYPEHRVVGAFSELHDGLRSAPPGLLIVDGSLGWTHVADAVRLANDNERPPVCVAVGGKSPSLDELKELIDLGLSTLIGWPIDGDTLREKLRYALSEATPGAR